MSLSTEEALALAERIENALNCPDPASNLGDDNIRRRLREAGRKLSLAMEAPGDTIHRINNTVSCNCSFLGLFSCVNFNCSAAATCPCPHRS